MTLSGEFQRHNPLLEAVRFFGIGNGRKPFSIDPKKCVPGTKDPDFVPCSGIQVLVVYFRRLLK
jgi:hypothetical protein